MSIKNSLKRRRFSKSRRFLGVLLLFLIPGVFPGTNAAGDPAVVLCKHFFFGYPTGTHASNQMVIRDAYALSNNSRTKLADWVAYRLDKGTVTGERELRYEWKADPWLKEQDTLEPDDYAVADKSIKVDHGYYAPLASLKGSPEGEEANCLSNIAPRRKELNRGPWRRLEEAERRLARAGRTVYVLTGPLYERDMFPLPKANEPHFVPSGFWKIILIQPDANYSSIQSAAFLFPQRARKSTSVLRHLTTIDAIERRTRLDFLRDLPDDVEERIESQQNKSWAKKNFKDDGKE
jgi:endonuclease G